MTGLQNLKNDWKVGILMFDYDTWLSTPPEPPVSIWELDEYLDRAYDEQKDNVAMGYEQKKEKRK